MDKRNKGNDSHVLNDGHQKYENNTNPAGNSMFKVINRNSRTKYEICSKLTIKEPERRDWRRSRRSSVFIVNFEYISHLALVFLLLTLNRLGMPAGNGMCWS